MSEAGSRSGYDLESWGGGSQEITCEQMLLTAFLMVQLLGMACTAKSAGVIGGSSPLPNKASKTALCLIFSLVDSLRQAVSCTDNPASLCEQGGTSFCGPIVR